MRGKRLIAFALIASFFCIAYFLPILSSQFGQVEARGRERIAGVREGIDLKFITERSPYMRAER